MVQLKIHLALVYLLVLDLDSIRDTVVLYFVIFHLLAAAASLCISLNSLGFVDA